MSIVIKVENLGKRYKIGQKTAYNYRSFRDVLANTFKFKKDKKTKSEFWALKDVSFEIGQGEVVGIIGRNGAGKSTLLKILSRITEPTKGYAKIRGRVGSLLEVGTGFHPELTGRENIYLNGSILGMKRREITKKFDEIVDFAEVEKFIDTPVKHYSSGMYVRLAFAVAAHLEPEILIVDEVLAVGDVAFQKKCLSKISNIAKEGMTILFVSHNLAAIRAICKRAIQLQNGQVLIDDSAENSVNHYLKNGVASKAIITWSEETAPQSPELRFAQAYITNSERELINTIDIRKGFVLNLEYQILKPIKGLRIGFFLQNSEGIPLCGSNDPEAWTQEYRTIGYYKSTCSFPGYTLNAGQYVSRFGADAPPYTNKFIETPFCITFTIEDTQGHGPHKEKLPGVIRPNLKWEISKA